MKPVRYCHLMRADPRPRLFGFQSPGPVRAWALRLLEDRSEDDFMVRHALRDAARYEPRVDLLRDWRAEGHWGVDRLFMRARGEAAAQDKAVIDAIRSLGLLHLYCWQGREGEGHLSEAAELILDWAESVHLFARHRPDQQKVRSEGITGTVRLNHWAGIGIKLLLMLGIEDPRIEVFCEWLVSAQSDDGGWPPRVVADRRAEGGSALPGHPLYTAAFAYALNSHPRWTGSETVRRAAEFLLNHALLPVAPYRRAGAARWLQLANPQWGYDAITALELALDAGLTDHPHLQRVARRLAEEQDVSGLWRARPPWCPGPDEDLFVTLRAAVVLKRLIDDCGLVDILS